MTHSPYPVVLSAVARQRRDMKRPPKTVDEYLDALHQVMPQTVKELSKFRLLI